MLIRHPRDAGPPPDRRRSVTAVGPATLLAAAALVLLAGCGAGGGRGSKTTSDASAPSYVIKPFTQEQRLVEQGARLIVADGCSACHLPGNGRKPAPSFTSFAGHRLTLADGRRVLVDERFLREGLLNPARNEIKGFDPAPMLQALTRLHLAKHPQQLAALAAFIEQVGPEP
jgi:hypothetical protein